MRTSRSLLDVRADAASLALRPPEGWLASQGPFQAANHQGDLPPWRLPSFIVAATPLQRPAIFASPALGLLADPKSRASVDFDTPAVVERGSCGKESRGEFSEVCCNPTNEAVQNTNAELR
jgi:hypothetical protein